MYEGEIVQVDKLNNQSVFIKLNNTPQHCTGNNTEICNTNIENDTFSLTNKAETEIKKNKNILKIAFTALSPIIPFRRISSMPDKVENGDYKGLAGLLAVAGIMLPEDLRDMKDAYNQIFKGILPKYKFKEFQTPFSFIRGTLLQPVVNKMGKVGYMIHQGDKTLLDTKFGDKVKDILKVNESLDEKETGRIINKIVKSDNNYIIGEARVKAIKLEGSFLGKTICRAMQRTTVYGLAALTAICVPSIINAYKKGSTNEEKIAAGGKQLIKSAISVVSVTAGIGLLGALLAPLGPAGSVFGMGIGSVTGAYISKKINNNIFN
jgi:hypothetical protein